MGPIIAFLLAVYLLSPIPLLIFLIASRHSIRRMEEDHARKEAYHQYTEEQYRRYVSQLQNQVRELDPDARLGVLQKPIPSPENAPVPSPVAEVLPKEAPAAPAVIQAQPIPEMPVRQELPEVSFSESAKENSFSTLILVVGVVLLVNPWWDTPSALKQVIGGMMLFSSLVSIIRTIMTWPFKSV